MTLRLNVIGAGKCGQTLGRLLYDAGGVELAGVYNSNLASSNQAIAFMGGGIAVTDIKTLPTADLYLITTPDSLISATALALSRHHHFTPDAIVLHASGALTSEALAPLQKHCQLASVHPANTFAYPEQACKQFENTVCAMEGDANATRRLIPLFKAIGGKPVLIQKEQKRKYHIAGVMASNYLVTLAHQAQDLLVQSGIAHDLAGEMTLHYMQTALDNIQQCSDVRAALTGPIQRGDVETLQAHLQALNDSDQKALYKHMGLAALKMTAHDEEMIGKITAILAAEE